MMKIRIASTLLALALPLVAQEPASSQVEAVFYKAYYLEKGQRDFAGAMALYQQFLEKAPSHKLAKEAAKQQFRLLDRTGKTKERDAFQAKYKELIGDMTTGSRRPARPERGQGERPERGGDRGGFGGRDRGGRGGGMRGVMQLMRGEAKVSEMSKEQLEQLKEGIAGAEGMIDRMRRFVGEEAADKMAKSAADLKKALEAGKMEDADKALNALKEAFPMGRGRGRGGDQGGRGRGRGGEEGGRGRGGEEGGRGRQGRGGEGRGGQGRGREGRGGGAGGAGGGGGGGGN